LTADKDLLLSLFNAVIKNAIMASPEGARITISYSCSKDGASVQAKDKGCGITADLLPIIFERFRNLHGKPLPGLGLPLALAICKLHNASIQINSSVPGETVVEIKVPS
jgi:signal transduction histidine kinase